MESVWLQCHSAVILSIFQRWGFLCSLFIVNIFFFIFHMCCDSLIEIRKQKTLQWPEAFVNSIMLYNEVLIQYSSTHLYLKINSVVFVRCFYLFGLQIILSEHVFLLTLAVMLAPHVSWYPVIWAYYFFFSIGLLWGLTEIPYIRFVAQYLAFKWSWSFFLSPCHHLLILKMGTFWAIWFGWVRVWGSKCEEVWQCLWEGK